MTDTGQVPGEGLPENAGMVEQPGVPAHGTYTYLSETTAEDEDLLLPGAQGAWGNEVPPPAPEPLVEVEAVHEPGPHETDGRDSGSADPGAFRPPHPHPAPAPAAAPATPPRPLHLGPPIPDTSASPVRSLADRGPAQAPARHAGPPATGSEYLDAPQPAEVTPQGATPWGTQVPGPGVQAPAAGTVAPATEPAGAAQAAARLASGAAVAGQAPEAAYAATADADAAPAPYAQEGAVAPQGPESAPAPYAEYAQYAEGENAAEAAQEAQTGAPGEVPAPAPAPQPGLPGDGGQAAEAAQAPEHTAPEAESAGPAEGAPAPQGDGPADGGAQAPAESGPLPEDAQVAQDAAQAPEAAPAVEAAPAADAAPAVVAVPAAEDGQPAPDGAQTPEAGAVADGAQIPEAGQPAEPAPEASQAPAPEPVTAPEAAAPQPDAAVPGRAPDGTLPAAGEAAQPAPAAGAAHPAAPTGQSEAPLAAEPGQPQPAGPVPDAEWAGAAVPAAPGGHAADPAQAAEAPAPEAGPYAEAVPQPAAPEPQAPAAGPAQTPAQMQDPLPQAADVAAADVAAEVQPPAGSPADAAGTGPAPQAPAAHPPAVGPQHPAAPAADAPGAPAPLPDQPADAAAQAPDTAPAAPAVPAAQEPGPQAPAAPAADEGAAARHADDPTARAAAPENQQEDQAEQGNQAEQEEQAEQMGQDGQTGQNGQDGQDAPAAQPARPTRPSGPAAPGYDPAEREAVLKVMRERRDIRNGFRSDPIPHEVLLRVLEAAHTAPSVGHSQPWDFVVIRSTETRRKMHELAMRQREAYARSLPKGRAKQFKELKIEAILDTPVNIVVTADPTRGGRHTLGRHTQPQMAPYSSALAVENLWLAARAEGLGVGWVSFFDEREMVRVLGLPEHLEVVAYLCIGYVDEFPQEPELMQAGWSKRRPLSWVVHEETYGRRALPGEEPHDLLAETVAGIRPLDAKALGEAWERQKRMTKPAGALGMLEIISAQLSGLSRQCPPPIPEPAAVAIFAGDHGVHAQGVTPWPQEVTAQMVANFLGGGAVCNAFANQVGAEVCVVDVGVAGDLPATPGLLPRKVRPGTADMTAGPAMTREEAKRAVEVGIETARDLVAAGNKALLTGEMGIANTTVSAALISVFTGADPAEVTGRGTGINDETLARKTEVVRRALELHQPDPADPIGVLAAIGGLEHAAMVGLLLGGASLRTPVILDGASAGAAALVARAIAPEVLAACIAGHRSAEPGHVAALNKLGLRPLVDLDLRLGEGTGALLALPLVQSAARAMHEVATFDSAGVTEK
ncbi:nicotinate-nucleotide--dimethylbenzimidazole phosphoribosyltransferase [Streptomyces echinoruber]|uniref:nicotinate-nucleotide--dimethylbenzimidazole phosphoribosyltransferase n=1 Tax=Streptomyces echinoruber TaxID=68898 RepID=UPI00361B6864